MNNVPKIGLYRHFKGGYYFLMNVLRNDDGEPLVQYVNVLHPELGYFCRPFSQWDEFVSDRPDNYTGQTSRFELVKDLDNTVKNISTDQLLRELRSREDSPLQDLDIDGISSLVYSRDYCIGESHEATEDYPKGVSVHEVFDTKDSAFHYMNSHARSNRFKVFRRVFIEEKHL